MLTRYGRRGAAGVASSKTFGTADEAAAFAASTVAEKLRKGYVYGEAEAAAANAIPVLTAPPFIPAPAGKPAASTKAATKTAKAEVAPPQPLAGMTFCITGHVSTVRADFEADIVAHWGAVTKTVTASTTPTPLFPSRRPLPSPALSPSQGAYATLSVLAEGRRSRAPLC